MPFCFGMIKIGIIDGSDGIRVNTPNFIGADSNSKIIFKGHITMAQGSTIKAICGGKLILGKNLWFNYNCKILCKHSITINDDSLFGWNVTISDGDGHPIFDESKKIINNPRDIIIGQHVWIGYNASIMKGSYISENSVVGCNSLVNKQFYEKNIIIGGIPAKLLKNNITWKS